MPDSMVNMDRLVLQLLKADAKGSELLQTYIDKNEAIAQGIVKEQENAELKQKLLAQEPQPEGRPGKPVLQKVEQQ